MERWVIPSLILTVLTWAAAFALMPFAGFSGVPPFFSMLPYWMLLSGVLALGYGFIQIIRMMLAGEAEPLAKIRALDWKRVAFVAGGALIAGLHMIAFMSIKPQLNHVVDFWADPLLADVDALIFFGDPWQHLMWLNNAFTADFYHRGWFAGIIAVLVWQLARPASADKSAKLMTYFAVWTLGPVIHCLLPAGGPIFYDDLGHGARFAALVPPQEIAEVADYLWRTYEAKTFAPGAGISAMPSLHIATVAWMVICCWQTRWFWPALAFALVTFLLSMSLGWHYGVDGILGALVAWGVWRVSSRIWFDREARFA